MNDFGRKQDSKEVKIRELNGWVRKLLYVLLGLVVFGTITGLVYWRRSVQAERKGEENRKTAVNLIVQAMAYRDSVEIRRDSVNFARLDAYWQKLFDHLGIDNHRKLPMPVQERADTAYLRDVFEKKEAK